MQIFQDLRRLFAVVFRGRVVIPVGADAPAQLHQELNGKRARKQIVRVRLAFGGGLQRREKLQQRLPAVIVRPQDAAFFPRRRGEAAVEPAARGRLRVEKRRVDIEDDTLVPLLRRNLRLVNRPALHQHDIIRLERVAAALHDVIALPGEEKDDLVKFVVVKRGILRQRGVEMKQTERFQQVAALFVVLFFHGRSFLSQHDLQTF